ncbi:MAG: NADP-dependent malic enzyme, partial [Bacteroidia bacterium]|nr:NADP-dependent malic enzyme [Bacteroidia bacterium]
EQQDLHDVPIIDPYSDDEEAHRNSYAELLWKKRQRKGMTLYDAKKIMRERNYFGSMMVETGAADAMISGLTRKYSGTLIPAMHCIGVSEGNKLVAGLYIIVTKKGPYFFADTTMNVNPTAEELVEITLLAANTIKQFSIIPRIAMLSYTNFGSVPGPVPDKMKKAVSLLHKNYPGLVVDGEIQANFAINNELLKEQFGFSQLVDKSVNTFIFPDLASGNICYKMMQELGGAEAIGPILMGLKKPVHILQLGSSVREIVNMITIAVVDAQNKR